MTAIAWAIVFIGLAFYSELYAESLAKLGTGGTLAKVVVFSLVMLLVCTVREWLR